MHQVTSQLPWLLPHPSPSHGDSLVVSLLIDMKSHTCTLSESVQLVQGQGMNTLSGSTRSYNLMSLNEDSTYTITVTAINGEGSRLSTITADTSTSGNHTIISCVVR